MGQYFAEEFLEYAGRLLTTMAYASAMEEEDAPEGPVARMGADWMDTMPDCIPIWPASVEVALVVANLDMRGNYPNIPDFIVRTLQHNEALPEDFDPAEPCYELIENMESPDGRHTSIVGYLASNFAHHMVGSGVGLFDEGWEWPPEWDAVISHSCEAYMDSLVPDWRERLKGWGPPDE